MQISVQYDLLNHHMLRVHIKMPPLDFEIYVELPEGFKGKNGNYVWKLKKSLYVF